MADGNPTHCDTTLPQRFEYQGKRRNPKRIRLIGVLLIVLGVVLMFALPLMAIDLGFIGNNVSFVMLVVGIFMLSTIGFYKATVNITVDETGLIIEQGSETKELPWSELRWAENNTAGGRIGITLYDQDMQAVAQVNKSIENFDTLWKLIDAKLTERPAEEIADAYLQRVRGYRRKQSRFAIPLIVIGLFLLSVPQLYPSEMPRLNKHGEYGWAEVIQLTKNDRGIPFLEYQVLVGEAYGPIEKVRMEPEPWETLKQQANDWEPTYVEVCYLKDDLAVSFASGQKMPCGYYSPFYLYLKGGAAVFIGLTMLLPSLIKREQKEKLTAAIEEGRRQQAATGSPTAEQA